MEKMEEIRKIKTGSFYDKNGEKDLVYVSHNGEVPGGLSRQFREMILNHVPYIDPVKKPEETQRLLEHYGTPKPTAAKMCDLLAADTEKKIISLKIGEVSIIALVTDREIRYTPSSIA